MPHPYSSNRFHPPKRRWHIVQGLFFIAVFSLAVFVFLQSSFFRVREIRVEGVKQLRKEDVMSLAGLSAGVNIFKANLNVATEKVALHPVVKRVRIERELPATIVIAVTERKPVGIIANQGSFIIVGDDGRYLSESNNLTGINLPFITGVKPSGAASGKKIIDENLKTAIDYLLAMPLNVRAAVSEINVSDLNNIRVFTIDKAEVRFGDNSRINEKINLYQEVISQKYQDKIQYIDISYKGNPVIKFVELNREETGVGP